MVLQVLSEDSLKVSYDNGRSEVAKAADVLRQAPLAGLYRCILPNGLCQFLHPHFHHVGSREEGGRLTFPIHDPFHFGGGGGFDSPIHPDPVLLARTCPGVIDAFWIVARVDDVDVVWIVAIHFLWKKNFHL